MEIVDILKGKNKIRKIASNSMDCDPSVALFTDSNVFAGTEKHILDLADGLQQLGVQVQIACPVPSPLQEIARGKGIKVLAIPNGGAIDFGAVRQLSAQLQSGELDLLHAHNGRTALLSVLATSWAGTGCCVFTQHFVEPGRLKCGGFERFLRGLIHRLVNRRIDRFIAISAAVLDSMLSRADAPQERIMTVLNGIPQPVVASLLNRASICALLGISEGKPLVACVARLEVEKDVPSLIEAMKHLTVTNPEIQCVIVGDGSQKNNLERRIQTLKLQRNVILTGFRSDAMAFINACDVFVLPSPAEPFGLVVLESMALGKPVVAIGNGGPAEIVVQEETGLLVPAHDAKALAVAIRRLIESPNDAARMGRAGQRRLAEHFSQCRMARGVLSVYKHALQTVAARHLKGQTEIK